MELKFLPKKGPDNRTEAEKMGGRRALRSGAYASVLGVVVLVAVILVNLVVGALPTKYTEFDISISKMFTLSDTTRNLLSSLPGKVTAYYLAETGNEDANITRLLDRYAGESGNFSWQQRDPALYPTFAQQYDAQSASSGSVILVCGDKSAVVDYSDMYEMDFSSYYTTGSYTYSFSAENALTTALAKVIRTNDYAAYQLTGHGESSLGSDFTTTLENTGFTLSDLNLVTAGSVPEDAALLVLNAPQADYAKDDIEALRSYLEGGGSLLVATDLNYTTPNLDALLEEYGMTRQEGLLIETDANHYAYRYPQTYLLPSIVSNDATSGVTSGMLVFAPIAQGILTDEESENTFVTLLRTSSSAFSMLDYLDAELVEQGEDDPVGAFALAVAASDAETGAKLVWINCGNVLNSDMNQAVSGGNAQLLGSIANWCVGEESTAVIDSRSMSAETLTVPATSAMGFGLLFTILAPVAILVAGAVVVLVRRRR